MPTILSISPKATYCLYKSSNNRLYACTLKEKKAKEQDENEILAYDFNNGFEIVIEDDDKEESNNDVIESPAENEEDEFKDATDGTDAPSTPTPKKQKTLISTSSSIQWSSNTSFYIPTIDDNLTLTISIITLLSHTLTQSETHTLLLPLDITKLSHSNSTLDCISLILHNNAYITISFPTLSNTVFLISTATEKNLNHHSYAIPDKDNACCIFPILTFNETSIELPSILIITSSKHQYLTALIPPPPPSLLHTSNLFNLHPISQTVENNMYGKVLEYLKPKNYLENTKKTANLLGKVAKSGLGLGFGFIGGLWRAGGGGGGDDESVDGLGLDEGKKEEKDQDDVNTIMLIPISKYSDSNKRYITQNNMCNSSSFLSATDSLGRTILYNINTLVGKSCGNFPFFVTDTDSNNGALLLTGDGFEAIKMIKGHRNGVGLILAARDHDHVLCFRNEVGNLTFFNTTNNVRCYECRGNRVDIIIQVDMFSIALILSSGCVRVIHGHDYIKLSSSSFSSPVPQPLTKLRQILSHPPPNTATSKTLHSLLTATIESVPFSLNDQYNLISILRQSDMPLFYNDDDLLVLFREVVLSNALKVLHSNEGNGGGSAYLVEALKGEVELIRCGVEAWVLVGKLNRDVGDMKEENPKSSSNSLFGDDDGDGDGGDDDDDEFESRKLFKNKKNVSLSFEPKQSSTSWIKNTHSPTNTPILSSASTSTPTSTSPGNNDELKQWISSWITIKKATATATLTPTSAPPSLNKFIRYITLSPTSTNQNRQVNGYEFSPTIPPNERVQLLHFLFSPLLYDVFSVTPLIDGVFTKLCMNNSQSGLTYVSLLFGEWFVETDRNDECLDCLDCLSNGNGARPGVLRFLSALIQKAYSLPLDTNPPLLNNTKTNTNLTLQPLQTYLYKNTTNLPKAWILSIICRDAVKQTLTLLEAKTLGLISSHNCTSTYDVGFKWYRVACLFALRLDITVCAEQVEGEGEGFNLRALVQRDLVVCCSGGKLIECLEVEGLAGRFVFENSSEAGDADVDPDLEGLYPYLIASVNQPISERCSSSSSSPFTPSSSPLPLIFYYPTLTTLKQPSTSNLAHRVLILASSFHMNLKTTVLKACMDNIHMLPRSTLKAVLALYVYETLRPICRAGMFGFDDGEVVEYCEEELKVELGCLEWVGSILGGARECVFIVSDAHDGNDDDVDVDVDDSILTPIVQGFKNHKPNQQSVSMHQSLIHAACFYIDYIRRTGNCDNFNLKDLTGLISTGSGAGVFTLGSLHFNFDSDTTNRNKEQDDFISWAIQDKVRSFKKESNTTDKSTSTFLLPILNFSNLWSVSISEIKTRYILEMLWSNHDIYISEMVSNNESSSSTSNSTILCELFVIQGVDVICYRLNCILNELRRVKELKYGIGVLDADVTSFVKERGVRIGKERNSKGFVKSYKWSNESEQMVVKEWGSMNLIATYNLTIHVLRHSGRVRVEKKDKFRLGDPGLLMDIQICHGLSMLAKGMVEIVKAAEKRALEALEEQGGGEEKE